MYSNKQGIYLVTIKLSRVECCWSGGGGGDLLGGNLLGPDLEQPSVSVLATTVTTSHRVIEMPTTCKHRLCVARTWMCRCTNIRLIPVPCQSFLVRYRPFFAGIGWLANATCHLQSSNSINTTIFLLYPWVFSSHPWHCPDWWLGIKLCSAGSITT